MTVDEFMQTQVLGEGDWKEQPSIGYQAVVVERDLDAVGVLSRRPLSQMHRSTFLLLQPVATLVFSVDWGLGGVGQVTDGQHVEFPLWGVELVGRQGGVGRDADQLLRQGAVIRVEFFE